MNNRENPAPTPPPLRLWPGVVAVVVQWVAWRVVPLVAPPEAAMYALIIGVFGGGLAFVVWWLFFSRVPWSERVGALVLMPVAVYATQQVAHESIANAGRGMMLRIFSIPLLSLALVAGAAASRRLSSGPRRVAMVAAILLACGVFTLVRSGGVSGEGHSDLHWRWTRSPEEQLLARAGDQPATLESPPPAKTPVESSEARVGEGQAAAPADWPGFRGPARDGVIPGVRIATDWTTSPPVELWRRTIGPAWSSFAVDGDLVYTQEQRGDDELVSCYRLTTGEPVWSHGDAVRFWESNAGAGPRATPTLANGRVFTFGATGILNAREASSGALLWSRNAAADTEVEIPEWGFASSPLVVENVDEAGENGVVVVAASGRLAAYDVATGHLRWLGPTGGGGYSSPHLVTIDGVAQILLLRGARSTSVAPADGTLLWEHRGQPAASIVQPALAAEGEVLIAAGDVMGGTGIRCLAVSRGGAGWTVEERWTSLGLKPYFNDYVVHQGHAFGFDGSILACIDLKDGTRRWKGGRYGHGQLLLLADQDLLLVLSEDGELVLVSATADQWRELARFPALEGKTWNHPALVGDVLLVRNAEEMAAFRLTLASS